MRLLKLTISVCTSIFIMAMIFYLSAQTAGESGSLSESIATFLARAFSSGFDSLDFAHQMEIIDGLAFPIRKAAHATEYAALGASLVATCWQTSMLFKERNGSKPTGMRTANARMQYLNGFVLSILYAISDEAHQLFVDGRSGQLADVLIDGCGALIGCTISYAAICAIVRAHSKDSNQNRD